MSQHDPAATLRGELSALLDQAEPTTAQEAIARARSRRPSPFLPPDRPGSRRPLVLPLAALVVAAVIAAVALAVPMGAGPAPNRASGPATWRLAGYLDLAAWSSVSPVPGFNAPIGLACPQGPTCWLGLDDIQVGPSVERSTDGGSAWRDLSLPSGVVGLSAMACRSATTCALIDRTPAPGTAVTPADRSLASALNGTTVNGLLTTTDSGATWTQEALPVGVERANNLVCTDARHCATWGLATLRAPGGAPSASSPAPATQAVSLTTADAGRHWVETPLPAGFTPYAISCSTATHCTAGGMVGPAADPTGAALYSDDAGRHWSTASVPGGLVQVAGFNCGAATSCLAPASSRAELGSNFPAHLPVSNNHPSVLLASDDGGATWRTTASAGLGQRYLYSLACFSAGQCYASGVGGVATGVQRTGQGVLVFTGDEAASWSQVVLPSTAGNVFGVGYLTCQAGGTCYALASQATPASPTGFRLLVLSNAGSAAGPG